MTTAVYCVVRFTSILSVPNERYILLRFHDLDYYTHDTHSWSPRLRREEPAPDVTFRAFHEISRTITSYHQSSVIRRGAPDTVVRRSTTHETFTRSNIAWWEANGKLHIMSLLKVLTFLASGGSCFKRAQAFTVPSSTGVSRRLNGARFPGVIDRRHQAVVCDILYFGIHCWYVDFSAFVGGDFGLFANPFVYSRCCMHCSRIHVRYLLKGMLTAY